MKIAVLGATGGTGLSLVQQALNAAHQVTAVVRDPNKITTKHDNLKIEKGNIFSQDNLAEIFKDQDVVMSCLGVNTTSCRRQTLYEDSIKCIVGGMRKAGVTRLICVTAAGARADSHAPWYWNWLMRPLLKRSYLDSMVVMEDYLVSECQDINFTVLKPPTLTDGPLDESEMVAVEAEVPPTRWEVDVTKANLAKYMLLCLTNQLWDKKLVAVATARTK